MWPWPGKEPLIDVNRAIFITIHHEATVLAAIHPLPQRHVLLAMTDMTSFGGIAFAYDMEFFPKTQALVCKHLHKAVETPIIIHQTVADLPLPPLFMGLVFLFFENHLPLGKIANNHSSFSQSARDKMRGFMQTVPLFAPFLFSYPFVHL